MAALRGERFHVDLDDGDDGDGSEQAGSARGATTSAPSLVKDVLERATGPARPPQAPAGLTTTGFPAHRKRVGTSRFKEQRAGGQSAPPAPASGPASASAAGPAGGPLDAAAIAARDRRDIDNENRQRLASMSPAEIEAERAELLANLPASLVRRLMARASIDDEPEVAGSWGRGHGPEQQDKEHGHENEHKHEHGHAQEHEHDSGRMEEQPDEQEAPTPRSKKTVTVKEASPTDDSTNLQPDGDGHDHGADAPDVHFPRPPHPPALDPASPSFYADLREKYFADLDADPDAMQWMREPTPAELREYSPAEDSVAVADLRFSFGGQILPPAAAAAIPTTRGLHHHGAAPAAAGYTVGELAHLARSAFPSQRCIAFQTLGRILYRLGRGEFRVGPHGGDIDRGLWGCMREGRVLDVLQHEAARTGGHVSARAYAVDALWLWQKGGGRDAREMTAA